MSSIPHLQALEYQRPGNPNLSLPYGPGLDQPILLWSHLTHVRQNADVTGDVVFDLKVKVGVL